MSDSFVTETLPNGNTIRYRRNLRGTCFRVDTREAVCTLLEHFRFINRRIKIHYGDAKTGEAWGDVSTGRVGRSTGTIKIPIMLHNSRSHGGGAILDHCIVKIECADKREGGVHWVHSNFHERSDSGKSNPKDALSGQRSR